jgi:flagellar assembly factor FliW
MKTLVNPYAIKSGKPTDDAKAVDPYSRLVALPVQSENIFHFPEGIPAFENVKEFIFLSKPDSRPFMFMQALEPQDLNFVCIDPFLIHSGYAPKISTSDLNFLHLTDISDALVLSIVTVNQDMQQTTANLQGPIVINMRACIGKQIICDGQNYPVRYKIWQAIEEMEKQQAAQQQAARAAGAVH